MVMAIIQYAAIPLRIILGLIFIIHGYPKLFKDFKGTAKFLGGLNFKPAKFWAFILGFVEFFGGISILTGVFTRIFATLLIISMLVATYFNIFVWKKKFSGGYEFDLLIIAGLLTLILLGPSPGLF